MTKSDTPRPVRLLAANFTRWHAVTDDRQQCARCMRPATVVRTVIKIALHRKSVEAVAYCDKHKGASCPAVVKPAGTVNKLPDASI